MLLPQSHLAKTSGSQDSNRCLRLTLSSLFLGLSSAFEMKRGHEDKNLIAKATCVCVCQSLGQVQFSRQEYWSGEPFPSSGHLSNPVSNLDLWHCRQILYHLSHQEASMVSQTVKTLPSMWETRVRSLGWEDPLEKGLATHSSILAWRSPMDREESSGKPKGNFKNVKTRAV